MTTPDTSIKPVLGVDHTPTPAPQPAPTPAPTPAPASDPSKITVDAQEYAQLQQAAANYTTLVSDDQLRTTIFGHLRDRAAGIVSPQPDPSPAPSPNGNGGMSPDIEKRLAQIENGMRQGGEFITRQQQTITAQAEEIRRLQSNLFGRDNPSYKAHQADVDKLVERGLSREDALTLVEAKAARAGHGTGEGTNPPVSTTEGGGGGIPPNVRPHTPGGDVSEDAMTNLAAKINDPTAVPSMDDALDLIGREFGLDV